MTMYLRHNTKKSFLVVGMLSPVTHLKYASWETTVQTFAGDSRQIADNCNHFKFTGKCYLHIGTVIKFIAHKVTI